LVVTRIILYDCMTLILVYALVSGAPMQRDGEGRVPDQVDGMVDDMVAFALRVVTLGIQPSESMFVNGVTAFVGHDRLCFHGDMTWIPSG
jgi:hypothetical protein